ncbi:hypothetical protein K3495_g11327 [Podosphaera aphanis]|nr:hypothetical protein K3495_g11327 [Podosphaera aphanis]
MRESSVFKSGESRKRKFTPSSNQKQAGDRKDYKRVKMNDARSIVTQTTDAALKNGQLDVQSFIQSREFEIKALLNGMQKSKNSLNARSIQKVPRDMRRRTASHNVKRLPRRLRQRAEKEMKDGNTPTVTACKRKPGNSRGRIRSETAKRLENLAARKREIKQEKRKGSEIVTRLPRPKQKRDQINQPPKPKSKFRKRQIHKTWLPTHLWHAKRAKMTNPKNPLWRFALPLSPTQKSYRPTHRAGSARGAVIWDMSYMSTILLEGSSENLENVLKAVGLTEDWLWEEKGLKWRNGMRSWTGWLSRRDTDTNILIGPSTVFWCPENGDSEARMATKESKKKRSLRQALIRIHPVVFLETWTELVQLSKLQRPQVHLTDLRFEIGSIELTGPGSTEALLGTLHPFFQDEDSQEAHAKTFTSLSGVTNPGSLPLGAILSFSIMDPRLRYPPRPVKLPISTDDEAQFSLLKLLSEWPPDNSSGSMAICDPEARFRATRFPSQKAINYRKGLTAPGAYPALLPNDSPIPIILLASRSNGSSSFQGNWTLLAPWKCILPIWLGLVHYPLSSGGNPRFGGLQELQQITFEREEPWFPADYPGTKSGFSWEIKERIERKSEWEKKPKGRRVEWESLNLGNGRKGEIGRGWSNDFERLFQIPQIKIEDKELNPKETEEQVAQQISGKNFNSLLSNKNLELTSANTVATVRITLIGRGVATPCARIYRLPRDAASPDPSTSSEIPATTREQWLQLLPPKAKSKSTHALQSKQSLIPANIPLSQHVRLVAQTLLQSPPLQYPADRFTGETSPLVPDEEDLIGFVTTGKQCLSNGSGIAFGALHVNKVVGSLRDWGPNKDKHSRICVVRNAGEKTGRLARWEVVVDPLS